jgi:hypothetical protein
VQLQELAAAFGGYTAARYVHFFAWRQSSFFSSFTSS